VGVWVFSYWGVVVRLLVGYLDELGGWFVSFWNC